MDAKRWRLAPVAALAALALVTAGCGSSDEGSTGTGAGADTSASTAATSTGTTQTAAAPAGDVTPEMEKLGADYIGGKAGEKANGEPIKLGWINQQGGNPSQPEITQSADATVDFINNDLGGIRGRPIELVKCYVVSSEEDGQRCGQQLANDADVNATQLGLLVAGSGSAYNALKGRKAILGGVPLVPADFNAPTNFFFSAGLGTGRGAALFAAKNLGAKKIAVVYNAGNPAAQGTAQVIGDALKQVGAEAKSVGAQGNNFQAALLSSGAKTADAVIVIAVPNTCVPLAQAIKQLGITAPVLSQDFCAYPMVKDALGDLPQWYFSINGRNVHASGDPEVDTYNAVLNQYAKGAPNSAVWTMANLMLYAKVMNELGPDATPEQIQKAMTDYTGPIWAGDPAPKCGQLAKYKLAAVCSNMGWVYKYDGDGKWTDPTDGKGVQVF